MAIGLAELLTDIEKRMISLGYEDFEELYNSDHDIKSLKELKARIMQEQRDAKELKKERTKSIKLLRDFIVKISKVCKKDLYIYNGRYILPGELSKIDIKMDFIFEVKFPYIDVINEILFTRDKNEWVYISDIGVLKDILDEFPDEKEKILPKSKDVGNIISLADNDCDRYNALDRQLSEVLDGIENDADKFIELKIPFDDPEIVSMKKIFHIQYEDFPEIDVNIQLFPFLMDKGCGTLEFMSDLFYENEGDLTMYYARVKIPFSHFDVYMKFIYF